METNQNRSSNFELLRIVAMMSVVICHFIMGIGQYSNTVTHGSFFCFQRAMEGWTGQIGNILFMLISGYFLCDSEFKWKRLLKTWFNLFSIAVVCGLVFFIFRIPSQGFDITKDATSSFFDAATPISKIDLLKCFVPTIKSMAWYATCYIVFYCFTPVLKKVLSILDQKLHFYLLVLMFVLGTVIKMIPTQRVLDPSNLYFFIFAYFMAAYIKHYKPSLFEKQWINITMSITCLIILAGWTLFTHFVFEKYPQYAEYKRFFTFGRIACFPVWITAICIFNAFRLMKLKYSSFINSVANSTFDVYLFHTNFVISNLLWFGVLNTHKLIQTGRQWPSLLAIPSLFIVCWILHKVRIYLIEKPLLPVLEKMILTLANSKS